MPWIGNISYRSEEKHTSQTIHVELIDQGGKERLLEIENEIKPDMFKQEHSDISIFTSVNQNNLHF